MEEGVSSRLLFTEFKTDISGQSCRILKSRNTGYNYITQANFKSEDSILEFLHFFLHFLCGLRNIWLVVYRRKLRRIVTFQNRIIYHEHRKFFTIINTERSKVFILVYNSFEFDFQHHEKNNNIDIKYRIKDYQQLTRV